jgi:hypothetical protein
MRLQPSETARVFVTEQRQRAVGFDEDSGQRIDDHLVQRGAVAPQKR